MSFFFVRLTLRRFRKTAAMAAASATGDSPLFLVDYLLRLLRVLVLLALWRQIFAHRGIVSGAEVDKVATCKFDIFYGKLKNAPLIEQCPVNLACKVEHILKLGTHYLVIGLVEETHVSENCLTEGKPDFRKINPLIYGMGPMSEYFKLGESLGKSFSVGKDLAGKI